MNCEAREDPLGGNENSKINGKDEVCKTDEEKIHEMSNEDSSNQYLNEYYTINKPQDGDYYSDSDYLKCEGDVQENFSSRDEGQSGETTDPDRSDEVKRVVLDKKQKGQLKSADCIECSEQRCNSLKKEKRITTRQLILVSVASSLLGAILVAVIFMFLYPSIESSIDGLVNRVLVGKDSNSSISRMLASNNSSIYKKVEIEKSQTPIVAIAQKVGPSVVGIRATVKVTDFFFGTQESQPQGSGIIIRSDGYIMTNNHVVTDALSTRSNNLRNGSKIEVILPNQIDKPYTATVVGRDEKTDLAVLKIDATNLPAAELGNSDDVKVGELAVAIGNPGGLEYMGSVTAGIISGLNRTTPIEDGKELKLLQTDAAINPGNSGGALVNSSGQVIGVNTVKIGGQGYEGLGFAIPINKVKEITGNLIEYKYVKGRPLLGIIAEPRYTEDFAKENNMQMGVYVAEVSLFTGAYKAGIKPGDIITKFDGKAVKTVDDINEIKNKHKPKDVIKVEIYRDGNAKVLDIELS